MAASRAFRRAQQVFARTCWRGAWSARRAAARERSSAGRRGYFGCLRAAKDACENSVLVRRTVAEKVIVQAVRRRLDERDVASVLKQVERAPARLSSTLPEDLRLREAELATEQRRQANIIDLVGEGRGSRALAQAMLETEARVEALAEDAASLRASARRILAPPPVEWIHERLADLRDVHGRDPASSARRLRRVLGPIRLDLVHPAIGDRSCVP